MTASYREFLETVAPTILRSTVGGALLGAIGGLPSDTLAQMISDAVHAPWIGDTSVVGPAYDALGPAGRELSLPRFPADTWATYSARLERAREDWSFAGDESSIIGQLAAFGVTAEIKHDHEWNWDGTTWETRFWVLIREGHPWVPRTLGEGYDLDGTWTLGSSAAPAELATVRGIVRQFKPSDFKCERIIVIFDDAAFDATPPDGTWDKPENRNPAAIYWPSASAL